MKDNFAREILHCLRKACDRNRGETMLVVQSVGETIAPQQSNAESNELP